MPNRILKESIRTSKHVNAMTDFQFRLWTYLITYVDDFGRGDADPEILKGFVFPRRKGVTEKNIADALHGLACAGSVILYEVDGEPYLCFPNWNDHQRIQSKVSKYPAPEDGTILIDSTVTHGDSRCSTVTHGDSRCSTVTHGDSPLESNPIQSNTNSESESESENNPIQSNPKQSSRKECSDIISRYKGDKDELLGALKRFSEMRVKIKKPLTDAAKEMLLKKLTEFPEEQWVAILDQSVLHCWQGVFPLKDAPQTVQSVPKAKGNAVEYEESHRKLDDYALAAIRRAMAEEA